ncbi:M20 peptidase aminoacylase family protein [Paenibacillus glycanilyticus]|uniref:M20 peptidase aminoacylase family protein n=1 Tax=Paenibacillus glycanilyticus TaxID=126569 RepID=UPI000FD7A57D|nr:M20 peptidase aminoacylase family protein [Paenibacillus glycanilyticus]
MSNDTTTRSAAALASRLTDIRRELHRNPELSHEEFETTIRIKSWLEAGGIRIADYPLKTGVIAEIGTGSPVIALRADIDALPIQEETGLPFASAVPGKMHACGHDFHTAALIGAAYLLKEREQELKGTVRLIFQPAEEKAKGARQVIASGALEGVQAIFGLHNKPDLPVGTIGIKGGPLMAAADGFVVEVAGRGSHAAVPEAGNDPVLTAAHIVTALQSIVSRNVGALDSAVISVTKLNSGTAWNVIPEKAVLDGTIRTFDPDIRRRVRERFDQVVAGVAAAFDTTAVVRWIEGPPPVHNDEGLAELAWREAERLELLPVNPVPSLAGEDFAAYQQQVPGLFVFVGTDGPQEWHHPAFDLDERALPVAADFLAGTAIHALSHFAAEPQDPKEDFQ